MAYKNRRSFTLLELLNIFCIILILIGLFMSYLNTTAKVAKDTALTTELNNIRMAIEVYRVINGKAPDDLNALAKQQLTYKESDGSIIGKPYIDIARVDKDGSLADPFLNKYYYNATSGKVSSQTKGYESW